MKELLTTALLTAFLLMACAPTIAMVPVSDAPDSPHVTVWSLPAGDSRVCVSPTESGESDDGASTTAEGGEEVEGGCTVAIRGGHISETFTGLVTGLANIVGAVFGGTRVLNAQ